MLILWMQQCSGNKYKTNQLKLSNGNVNVKFAKCMKWNACKVKFEMLEITARLGVCCEMPVTTSDCKL